METVLKIASFRTFLKGIQERFVTFKKASKEAIEARKAFYEGFGINFLEKKENKDYS